MRRDPDALFAPRPSKKKLPFDFVLEELADLAPWTRPMFTGTAVYVGEKIVFMLRDKNRDADSGVWIATAPEYDASLKRELPCMRSIAILYRWGDGWQVLPAEADDFEECVLRACELVRAGDRRVGRIPKGKRKRDGAGKEPTKRARSRLRR